MSDRYHGRGFAPHSHGTPAGSLSAYAKDPVGFARDVLRLELHPKQAEILTALVSFPRVAAPSGFASGSTTTAAVAVIWWTSTRWPALAVTLAPTERQSENILWRRIRNLHRQAGILPGRPGRSHWTLDGARLALGLTSFLKAPEELFETPNVLLVEDGGAEQPLDLPLGPGCRYLKTGHISSWVTVPVSSEVVAGYGVVGLASPDWVDRINRTYGVDSDFYRSRVLGVARGRVP